MLITLVQAKRHLRIDHDADDADITDKVKQASDIILDFLKVVDTLWQDTQGEPVGVPPRVEAATLLVVGTLFKDREAANPITQGIKDLLRRTRIPAYAFKSDLPDPL